MMAACRQTDETVRKLSFVDISNLFGMDEDDDDDDWFCEPVDYTDKGSESGDFELEIDEPPPYLMKAILAGLYELPPPHILKYQTGWGRRVRYQTVHRFPANFCPLTNNVEYDDECIDTIERMTLQRYTNFDDQHATEAFDFDIYRVCLSDTCISWLNRELIDVAMSQETQGIGLNVSNAGGAYHGPPNFFSSTLPCQQTLCRAVQTAIRFIERLYNNNNGRTSDNDCCPGTSTSEELALEPEEMESWVNISRKGSWNRLHTHEGSAWSGVYYVQTSLPSPVDNDADAWCGAGSLVLKPTAHPVEDTYLLTARERARLRPRRGGQRRQSHNNNAVFTTGRYAEDREVLLPKVDEGSYLDITPVAGNMILFPGWLHHCVLPTTMDDPPRISVAFNINWQSLTNRNQPQS